MKELPGDVFVTGQILPAQLQALSEQGVMAFINNRPDMEAPLQPLSGDMSDAAQQAQVDYVHIPMAGVPLWRFALAAHGRQRCGALPM